MKVNRNKSARRHAAHQHKLAKANRRVHALLKKKANGRLA